MRLRMIRARLGGGGSAGSAGCVKSGVWSMARPLAPPNEVLMMAGRPSPAPRRGRDPLDSASRPPQTAGTLPAIVLTVEPDPDGHVMADVVRILLDEMRSAQSSAR